MRFMKRKISLLVMLGLTSGCSIINSSLEYTEGTQYLNKQNYPEAVKHLELAVQLDPLMGRNHNNLALAYMGIGNMEEAWRHSRQAVLCTDCDKIYLLTFMELFDFCVVRKGLNNKGASVEEIKEHLGKPDLWMTDKDSNEITDMMYGRCVMQFSQGKLTKYDFLMLPHELAKTKHNRPA